MGWVIVKIMNLIYIIQIKINLLYKIFRFFIINDYLLKFFK